MSTLLFQQPLLFAAWAVAFLIALSIHEFSHAAVATWLGDETARRMGRVTLNPLAHVDPIGFLALVFIGFGWGKPVPFNPYNLRWPKWGPVAIAIAGPLSNLVLAIISALLFVNLAPRLGMENLLIVLLMTLAQLNIALLAFNLVPLPPLDGSKALLAFLTGPKYASARIFLETRGPMLLLALIFADSFLNLGIFSTLFGLARAFVSLVISVVPRLF